MVEPILIAAAADPWRLSQGEIAVYALLCFVISWVLTGRLIAWAPRLGLVDLPSERKVHTMPTPRGGGLALAFAVLVPICLRQSIPYLSGAVPWPALTQWTLSLDRPLLFALSVVVVGALDDRFTLPWQFRLVFQFAVAIGTVQAGFGHQPWLVQAVGVFWLVAMINAFNMLDNMDALSGGVAWIGCAGLMALAPVPEAWRHAAGPGQAMPYLLLFAALPGFLWYNRPPARIFMGDAGSMFLGFMVGLGALRLALGPDAPPLAPLAAICLCAVPIYDQCTVVLLRLSQGRSPFHADRQHLSHRLAARGLTHRHAVAWIHRLALVSGAAGLLVYALPNPSMALTVFAVSLLGWLVLAWWEFGSGLSATRKPVADSRPHRGE